MKSQILVSAALAGLAYAVPRPQLIDLSAMDAAPNPVLVTPAYDIAIQTDTATKKRAVEARDGNCAQQPLGSGPVSSPDTAAAFAANQNLTAFALNAGTPDGYSLVFSNQTGSVSASNYMGLYTLTSYDTYGCQSRCDRASGCVAFNVYIERDPTLDSNAVQCPNPPSTTNFKCTLWGAPLSVAEATNTGQWRDSFQVLITASNAYNKASPPAAISGFTGPTELGGAINAPTNSGSYMGYKFYPFSQTQGYTPPTCATACTSQTAYNKAHPASDGTYQTCAFFNSYVLSENGIPQGLYCSMYNQTWAKSYGVNYGQYSGSDRYTVSESYSYSLDPVTVAEAIIVSSSLQPFCSSLLSYTIPLTTIYSTATITGATTVITNTITATATSTTTVEGQAPAKRALSTPAALATFPASVLSSACSAEVTQANATSTVFVSATSTVTATSTAIATATSTVISTVYVPSCNSVQCPGSDATHCLSSDGTVISVACDTDGGFGVTAAATKSSYGQCADYSSPYKATGAVGFVWFPSSGGCFVYSLNNEQGVHNNPGTLNGFF